MQYSLRLLTKTESDGRILNRCHSSGTKSCQFICKSMCQTDTSSEAHEVMRFEIANA